MNTVNEQMNFLPRQTDYKNLQRKLELSLESCQNGLNALLSINLVLETIKY